MEYGLYVKRVLKNLKTALAQGLGDKFNWCIMGLF